MATPAPPRSPVTDAAVTQAAVQTGMALLMAREIRGAVANLDLENLKVSVPSLTAFMAVLTRRYGAASATLSVRHYTDLRRRAGVPGRYTVRPATPAPLMQVSSMVGWATKSLWAAEPDAQAADLQTAERNLITGAERLVLDAGRRTTVENVQQDRKARAWAREVRPECCSFCALMASRGAVYKTSDTAGRGTNERFTGAGQFKFHNNCHCAVVPVFGTFEMSSTAREAAAVYRDRGEGDALNAFRRAWEAR